MLTKTPSIHETTIAVCDQISDAYYGELNEARFLVGTRAMQFIGQPRIGEQSDIPVLQAVVRGAYDKVVQTAPEHDLQRENFYALIGLEPVYIPEDEPFQVSPADWPGQDPGQLPLFAA